jgi:cob(I)alamin adenosyltransferase
MREGPVKIYTKGGDSGQTGLFGGSRVGKDDLRVAAYGDVDELNAVLGLARAEGLPADLATKVVRVQAELFTLGAELATPNAAEDPRVPRLRKEWIDALEREIDVVEAEVAPLRSFILPGGALSAAWLHLARTVCRRAERSAVSLAKREDTGPLAIVYLNRLSDWLFMMARVANHRAKVDEPLWSPPL